MNHDKNAQKVSKNDRKVGEMGVRLLVKYR